jgi:hypothetical protein
MSFMGILRSRKAGALALLRIGVLILGVLYSTIAETGCKQTGKQVDRCVETQKPRTLNFMDENHFVLLRFNTHSNK